MPLAGPDFISDSGHVKAMIPFRGDFFLRKILNSRPWAIDVRRYIFILHDDSCVRDFVESSLKNWFPNSTFIYLSQFTRGAACSSLAGVSAISDFKSPLIIDLGDILYSTELNVNHFFETYSDCGAIAMTFTSNSPLYSYLEYNELGEFVESVEKKVISANASAGTYIFRDCSVFLNSSAFVFSNEEKYALDDLFYLCPLFNGVKECGLKVFNQHVENVVDIKNQQA